MHCTPDVGKNKHGLSIGLSIGSAKFKHERNAIMQHQPVFKLHLVQLPVKPPLGATWHSLSWCSLLSHSMQLVPCCIFIITYLTLNESGASGSIT